MKNVFFLYRNWNERREKKAYKQEKKWNNNIAYLYFL